MTKDQIIAELNKTDNWKALRFERVADDGKNTLLRKKCGKGFMFLNRFENYTDKKRR